MKLRQVEVVGTAQVSPFLIYPYKKLKSHLNTDGLTYIYIMASQRGFEPLTDGLEGRCSIQLSYWDTVFSEHAISKS